MEHIYMRNNNLLLSYYFYLITFIYICRLTSASVVV